MDVRFGSKADICSARRYVRFTPKSGHVQCNSACPLCANSGHSSIYSITSSGKILFGPRYQGSNCQCRIVDFAPCLPNRRGGCGPGFENNMTCWKPDAPK